MVLTLLYSCRKETPRSSAYVPPVIVTDYEAEALLEKHSIEVVVHRGANHLAPENTYASAAKAIELGVDYVEIDVQLSLEGEHYIIHDITLGRTTNGWGPVRLRSPEYIDKLDAGSWFDESFASEPVPRLRAYLQWIRGKSRVYLDVKTADLEVVVQMIRELDMSDQVFFWFWSDAMAQELRRLAPDMGLKVNADSPAEARKAAEQLGASIIECKVSEIDRELIDTCRELGLRIMAYADSNTREEYEAVIRSGADLVNLDRPRLYISVLDSLQKAEASGLRP